MRPPRLRISGRHRELFFRIVFPGDGREAVAIALCGRHSADDFEYLTVHEVHAVPDGAYSERASDRVSWTTNWLIPLLLRAEKQRWAVMKVHSHPTGFAHFSTLDDAADRALFGSVHGWTEDVPVHVSAIMLPDGKIIARGVLQDGTFVGVDRIVVSGDTIDVLDVHDNSSQSPSWVARHEQALGSATTSLLGRLRVGIVGCSGTGSFVIEMMARLGTGALVLVDPELVEEANLNRITFAYRGDLGRAKVEVAADHVRRMGLGTTVLPVRSDLSSAPTIAALARCDVIFGCMDSHDGRRLLNRLATFYVVPYLDVGVRIDADGSGGVDHVSGGVHYVQPGGSSLLSRGVIDNELATAEALRRAEPTNYERLRKEGYVRGAQETRPAVISVNGLFASLAVNDLLARLHGFRVDNAAYAQQRLMLHDPCYVADGDGPLCEGLAHHVGRADTNPPLDMPELGTLTQ